MFAVFQASDTSTSLTVDEINVVDLFGVCETITDIFLLEGNAFGISFTPPDVPFQWQIVGRDEEGYTFSRISDTAIEVSNIDLSLGNITITKTLCSYIVTPVIMFALAWPQQHKFLSL